MTNTDRIQEPFGEWAKSVQIRLNHEYSASKTIIDQGTLLGNIREGVVRDILTGFLPRSIEIGTGQVIDALGQRSKQVDIVIAHDSTPVFRIGSGVSAYLYESVLATVEVKSMLNREKLLVH